MNHESIILAPTEIYNFSSRESRNLMDTFDPMISTVRDAGRRWISMTGDKSEVRHISLKGGIDERSLAVIKTTDINFKRAAVEFFESYGKDKYPWFSDFIQIINGVRVTSSYADPDKRQTYLLDAMIPNGVMSFRVTSGNKKQAEVALMIEFTKISMNGVNEIEIMEDENLRVWLIAAIYNALSLTRHNVMQNADIKDIALRYAPSLNEGRMEMDREFASLMRANMLSEKNIIDIAPLIPTNWVRIAIGASGASLVTRIRNGSHIHFSPHEYEAKSTKNSNGTYSIWIRYRLESQLESPRELAEVAWLDISARIKTDFIDSFTAAYNAGVRSQQTK